MSPSVGCARNKRQYPTVLHNLKSFRWMLACEWMDYLFDFWDVLIEVLHSTNNTKRPIRLAPGNWCGTGILSSNKTKTKTPNERSNRDVDQLSNVDHVPSNKHSSQGESQLNIFEDSEAVSKMIFKGRSPTMRHVPRYHRDTLDWLFDRINLEPKLQIKYVDTKKNLLTC